MDWTRPTLPGPKTLSVDMLPAENDIPREFFDGHNVWNKEVQSWISTGVKFSNGKGTVKAAVALVHLTVAYSAIGTDYGHRVAGCAYLLSLWRRPKAARSPVCAFCHGEPAATGGTLCDECRAELSDQGSPLIRGPNDAF